MKKLIYIILFLPLFVFGQNTFYVATDGDDSNPGTFAEPWKTWGKGFNDSSISPGDTVYFRGGVYMKAWGEGDYYHVDGKSYKITASGEVNNYVHFFNYPSEVPILDSENIVPETNSNYAIRATTANYVHLKGLHVRNVLSVEGGIGGSSVEAFGAHIGGTKVFIENCKFYNIHGIGLRFAQSDTAIALNCDAYECVDSFAVSPQLPGNRGTGFHILDTREDITAEYTFKQCRAWRNGDQGFSGTCTQNITWDSCWSIANGDLSGEGHGWKLGWGRIHNQKRLVKNCIAAHNRAQGFTTNDLNKEYVINLSMYNNTAYHNGHDRTYPPGQPTYGIVIYNTAASDSLELTRIFRNNISYDNYSGEISVSGGALYTHSNNTWDIPIIVTDNMFLSVDSTGITGPRQEDGSLPDLNFMKLKSTSYLIDQGTDVGLPYNGSAPDLGAYEFTPADPPALPNVATGSITKLTPYTALVSVNLSFDGGGTILGSGVCWSTSEDPTMEDDKTEEGEQAGVFTTDASGLAKNTTYYFRAYATNSLGTSYGENVVYSTPAVIRIKDGSSFLKWNGQSIDW